ncbi:MAG: GGDEF domain-containing protein [Syntrophobacterales bacterium]|nr:GGDEF domain-containing protein [Syntrophobacterales bacterium]
MKDYSEVISVVRTIIERVPYPLGLSCGEGGLFLNERARNMLGGAFSLLLRKVGQEEKSLCIKLDTHRVLEIQIFPIGVELCSLLVFAEITDEKSIIKDELTGLFSRQYLNFIGNRVLEGMGSTEKVAILFMDLDGFKEINDTLGHDVGDEVLREVASRLLGSIRQRDLCFRWGGDEFVIISTGLVEKVHASLLARRLIKAVSTPIRIRGHDLRVGISIGIAVYPDDGSEISELLKKADTTMYLAKGQGGSMYRIFGVE